MALRASVRVLALGALLAGAAQLLLPVGAPLYDGVVVQEPYRYLTPPPNHTGSPTSFAQDYPVSGGTSPEITAATTENPPQAQLIALAGTFSPATGVATIHVSIDPVAPAAAPGAGTISGNVYRVAVSDPSGQPVPISASQRPTLAMRAAGLLSDGVIERFVNGSWQRLDTLPNTQLQIYTAQPDALGDFAVVDLGGTEGLSTNSLVLGGTVVAVIAAIAIWAVRVWLRRRALAVRLEAEAEAEAARRRVRPARRRPRR